MMPGSTELERRTLAELALLISKRVISPIDLVQSCLERIRSRNSDINAFISVFPDEAQSAGLRADEEIRRGCWRGPLHGIPVCIKDLIDLEGQPTTAASKLRAGHRADRDADVVARLKKAGAIIIGKNNLHEFACGTTSEHSAYGPVRHPFDQGRSAGGSSGGSAAAVTDGMAVASIGTDTGGSIRIPAAACGVVGFKPALGEVSCNGVVPLSRTLDHVGPITRSVADAAILFDVVRLDPPVNARRNRSAVELRLGIPRPYPVDRIDGPVRMVFDGAMQRLQEAGARLIETPIQHGGDTSAVYTHLMLPEAAAYHARTLERTPELYTTDVRFRLELGRYILAEDYVRALKGRQLLTAAVNQALERCDVLALPTLPIEPPPLGKTAIEIDGETESVRSLMLRLTQLFNVTGHPALTIPCGVTARGLPVGLQFVGRSSDELLAVAATCETLLSVEPRI